MNTTCNETSGCWPIVETHNTDHSPEEISSDDCAWILSNAFLVLTMQSGFGLLEAGCVHPKNAANIMVKNVVDVTFGGITYWAFGYGLSFGEPSNRFCGFGDWFFTVSDESKFGTMYTKYFFQFSFATAATTIVSGAIAERMKLSAYMIFSVFNTFVYVFPVAWVWNPVGFLNYLGFHDFAGACVVHATGGSSALVAAWMLGPRLGRFTKHDDHAGIHSPITALTGTFMLWWAWLGFNCGSTFGVDGDLWKVAAKVSVCTMNGSIGGCLSMILLSVIVSRGTTYDITYLINGILAGLVSVTACCAVITPWESLVIGSIGSFISAGALKLLDFCHIDDPVGAAAVHLFAGVWSTIAVGLFGHDEFGLQGIHTGLFRGGGWYLLSIQALGCLALCVWSAFFTAVIFLAMKFTVGIRMDMEHELLGADWVEHNVKTITLANKLENALNRAATNDMNEEAMVDIVKKVLEQVGQKQKQRQANVVSSVEQRKSIVETALSPATRMMLNMLWVSHRDTW